MTVRLAVIGALFAAVSVLAAPAQSFTITYSFMEPDNDAPSMIMKYYMLDGVKMRVDYLADDGSAFTTIIYRKDKDLVWNLYPGTNQYTEQALDQDTWDSAIPSGSSELSGQCQKTGETKILGYQCDILQMEQDGKTTNGYIAQDLNILLKTENIEDGEVTLTATATELDLNPPDDSLFEIPDGYTKAT